MDQLAAGFDTFWLDEGIRALPIEIVIWYRQNGLATAVRPLQFKLGGYAAIVGVRHQVVQQSGLIEGVIGYFGMPRFVRWNFNGGVYNDALTIKVAGFLL